MVKPHPNLWGVQILGRHKSCFASLRHLHFQKITSCHRIKLLFLIRSFIRTQKKQTRRTFSQLKHDNLVKHVFLLNPLHFSLLSLCIPDSCKSCFGLFLSEATRSKRCYSGQRALLNPKDSSKYCSNSSFGSRQVKDSSKYGLAFSKSPVCVNRCINANTASQTSG